MNAKTFFSDRVIAYHPVLAKVFGSVTSALFLSQLGYWSDKGADPSGWIWKTETEMTEETGLSRSEQQTAREMLVWAGVLQEVRKGVPARMWFKIDWEMLDIALTEYENERQARLVAAKAQPVVENQQQEAEIPQTIQRVPSQISPSLSKASEPESETPNPKRQALDTLEARFSKFGGFVPPALIERFYATYDGNPDHPAERLAHALAKLDETRSFFKAIDAYREWTLPKPPSTYQRAKPGLARASNVPKKELPSEAEIIAYRKMISERNAAMAAGGGVT